MDSLASIFLLGLGGLLAVAGGFFIARLTGSGRKVKELQMQLEAKQAELDDYRREVFEQFGETAKKFKTLNDSYVDLHAQLAKSAALLCGDLAADTLLEAPLMASIVDATADETITIDDEAVTVVENTVAIDNEAVTDVDVADADEDVEEDGEDVEEVDEDVEDIHEDAEEVAKTAQLADGLRPSAEVEATAAPRAAVAESSEIPTLEISQALEVENQVDNSHWVLAMEEVLQKLKQAPRETMGQDDLGIEPLRNAG